MALTQWLPRQNRTGAFQSTWMPKPAGAVAAYAQLDTAATDFTDPAQRLSYGADWSPDGGVTAYTLMGGGGFAGGPIETKSGVRSVGPQELPAAATHLRPWYSVDAGGPIRFGVLGAFRDAAGNDL